MGWKVPRDWEGQTAVILGGGPSLPVDQIESLKGRARVIAINDAGLYLAPWADVHYFADELWFKWNRENLDRFKGAYRITRGAWEHSSVEINHIRHSRRLSLSTDPGEVSGWCGGGNAINLAYHFGAKRIILVGFDMRPNGHWHDHHKVRSKPDHYAAKFIPAIEKMAPILQKAGVEVINASPGSALRCFPIMPLDKAMESAVYDERPNVEGDTCAERAAHAFPQPGSVLLIGIRDGKPPRTFKQAGFTGAALGTNADLVRGTGFAIVASAFPRLKAIGSRSYDYAFFEFVAEQLPPLDVAEAVRNIGRVVSRGAYVRVNLGEDVKSRRSLAWWRGRFEIAFPTIDHVWNQPAEAEMLLQHA